MKETEKFRYTEFEYNIDDGKWISLNGLSYLYMYNLKDGIHTINIRGWDDSGNPVVFDTIKVNHVTDFFKSTNFRYFLLFMVISLLGVTVFINYYNFRELNKVKTNIAMDLHDEIGTIINRSLYTLKDDPILNKNSQLINSLSEALFSIRTFINAFNVGNINIFQFIDEVKEHTINYFKNSGTKYNLTFQIEKDSNINSFIYRDLKLVIYEINQNILKHSKATIVNAHISIDNDQLNVYIQDNGVLINVHDLEMKGNGINNIRKRINRLKGEVNFSINSDGKGLKIEFRLKLAS
jgi:two-component sensor histidine kinase